MYMSTTPKDKPMVMVVQGKMVVLRMDPMTTINHQSLRLTFCTRIHC